MTKPFLITPLKADNELSLFLNDLVDVELAEIYLIIWSLSEHAVSRFSILPGVTISHEFQILHDADKSTHCQKVLHLVESLPLEQKEIIVEIWESSVELVENLQQSRQRSEVIGLDQLH